MDFNSTVKGSLLEGFYPEGWDFEKIDACCAHAPEAATERQSFWNKDFMPVQCGDVAEFDVKMGHEIANEIRKANAEKRKMAFILPVGPMGMYRWAVYFLKEWNESCENVWCFNMDEWSDDYGRSLLPKRHGNGILRSFGRADRSRSPKKFCDKGEPSDLSRKNRRAEKGGRKARPRLRHRQNVSYRVLGAAFRRGV